MSKWKRDDDIPVYLLVFGCTIHTEHGIGDKYQINMTILPNNAWWHGFDSLNY